MSERTVAHCEPDTTDGVVVNISVKAVDWVNDDPTHLIEYTPESPAAIGWEVKNGVVIVPPPPPEPELPEEE
jgi:hypothetical protein